MSKIFCLGTEWVKSVHDLKSDSYVKPLLEFLLNTAPHSGIDSYTFRNVCCKKDFDEFCIKVVHTMVWT